MKVDIEKLIATILEVDDQGGWQKEWQEGWRLDRDNHYLCLVMRTDGGRHYFNVPLDPDDPFRPMMLMTVAYLMGINPVNYFIKPMTRESAVLDYLRDKKETFTTEFELEVGVVDMVDDKEGRGKHLWRSYSVGGSSFAGIYEPPADHKTFVKKHAYHTLRLDLHPKYSDAV